MNKSASQVAMFVGAALNHPLPPCNGVGDISTIRVSQYKTKFNDIRIYCDLANRDLVSKRWKMLHHSGEENPPDSFVLRCLIDDATHYRHCYLSMIEILKDDDLISSLKIPANYPELLFPNKIELENYLNDNFNKSKTYPQYIETFYSRWKVLDFDSLKSLLFQISGF